MVPDGGALPVFNGYVYQAVRLRGKAMWKVTQITIAQIGPTMRGTVAHWRAAHRVFAAAVAEWEQKPVEPLTPTQLLEGARAIFGATCRYYTEIQTCLPAASTSDVLFTFVYNRLTRRKQDPPASTFLVGFDAVALQAEKSLFDLAGWAASKLPLAEYLHQAASETLAADFTQPSPPGALPADI